MMQATIDRALSVQRISLSWFSRLGLSLEPLKTIQTTEKLDPSAFLSLYKAKEYLDALLDPNITLQLRASYAPLHSLSDSINRIVTSDNAEQEFDNIKYAITNQVNQLEPILNGELSVQNSYLVWPKRAYDVNLLALDATRLFSYSVRNEFLPLEIYDVEQAGKCLAFEVPTAALFHIFRATDSVLRRYYKAMTAVEPKPKMRNWGTYISNLRKLPPTQEAEKILHVLEQIKDLHRNPVIHPESQVSIEEALSFLGIAESIISAMIVEIIKKRTESESTASVQDTFVGVVLPAPGDMVG